MMDDQPKKAFAHMPSHLGTLVQKHVAIQTAAKNHAQKHNDALADKRRKMETEQNMMKDIPAGGL